MKGIPKQKNGKYLQCKICKKKFYIPEYRQDIANYCSNKCRGISLIGKRTSPDTEFKKGQIAWNKGIKFPNKTNENNNNWKGDNVGYNGIHRWVYRYKGKPKICKHCNKIKNIQWANINHQYKRKIEDFISLCSSCHKLYDIKYNHIPVPIRNEKGKFKKSN